ncbi:peptide chain release factor N(5)-glutamine methyltransferase [Candidatus Clostridium stratigraminis]|uniref:Release factor glutamine methyltransferase n=1 Tax=Candidatus Clostridium stratigraminis TaxID=3381661 RepID=A0ABW8SZQ9_9CLOT
MKIQQLLTKGYEILKYNNENYILDSQLILGKVLNLDRVSIIINRDKEVSEKSVIEYFRLIDLRKNKMPIKYIIEETEFMGISFFVKQGVLIPRPDTEILVEEVLKLTNKKDSLKICDVCCGSGAIGLSIAKILDNSEVYCSDISEIACEVTSRNIELLSLQHNAHFYRSDLLQFAIDNKLKFNIVVSNPPYIRTSVIPTLMEDVKDYEPYIALWGGEDGLNFYRSITKQSLQVLNEHGVLAYEIGYDQAEEVKGILEENGFSNIKIIKDLAGLNRVIIATLN